MKITLLGATGSIGKSTLDVIARSAEQFQIFALSANTNSELLLQQCLQFKPKFAVLVDAKAANILQQQLKEHHLATEVLIGEAGLIAISQAPEVDCVVAAIVGAAGLLPTLAAVRAGKRILLANKEALVMSGALFMNAARESGAVILPVDSEHNAIFQCMPAGFKPGHSHQGIRKLLLTASGGPFLNLPLDQFEQVTPAQACAHPNWRMGPKVSIDSATMMNKALEVIEAHWLFNIAPEQIEVVLHPQSIIHSMVEYEDSSVLAQLGNPDMRTPIANALAWPQRINSGVASLDLIKIGRLDFAPLDAKRYPSLELAYLALKKGGTATAILNAANEVAVQAFVNEQIVFTDIARLNREILTKLSATAADSIDAILAADAQARIAAQMWVENLLFSLNS